MAICDSAALPPDVRKGFAFPAESLFDLGGYASARHSLAMKIRE